MLREIIIPQSDEHIVHIPKEYINTKVEILVLPFSYPNNEENEEYKTISKLERFRQLRAKSKNKTKLTMDIATNTNEEDIFLETAGILNRSHHLG